MRRPSHSLRISVIKTTLIKGPFHPWYRLKVKRGILRIIVEFIRDDVMLVHAIIPRWDNTYDEALDLWKHYRRRNDGK